MKKCPRCAEDVQDKAKICRFCGKRFFTNDQLWVAALCVVAAAGYAGVMYNNATKTPVAAAPAKPGATPFSAEQKRSRKQVCDNLIQAASKDRLLRRYRDTLSIEVDETGWALAEWEHKKSFLHCIAIADAGGDSAGDRIVLAYGVRSGKVVAQASPGRGFYKPE